MSVSGKLEDLVPTQEVAETSAHVAPYLMLIRQALKVCALLSALPYSYQAYCRF